MKKVERLREIGSSFDAKIAPLINAEQQQKFQAMREQMRKRLIERMASELEGKLKADASSLLYDEHPTKR